MKKCLLLLVTTVVMAAVVDAQIEKKEVKHELKVLHQEERLTKQELRKERKQLQQLEVKEVSYQSMQAFYHDFGNVPDATGLRGAYYDEVTFTNNHGKRITAYYDYDAKLVGTTTRKNFSDLPRKAQKYIDKKYPGYSKEGVIFFRDNTANETDMVLYGGQFEDADNYFVALKNGIEEIIVHVDRSGGVNFFQKI